MFTKHKQTKEQARFGHHSPNAAADLDPVSEEGDILDSDSNVGGGSQTGGGGSSHGGTAASGEGNSVDVSCELKKLAGKDNRNVRIWKFMVVTIIVVAGALVSTGIFFYLKYQEKEQIKDNVSDKSKQQRLAGKPTNRQESFGPWPLAGM